ncbi:hypothetical protein MUGA111182_16890 [Mucilaginibacter galii]|nr:hypothetical protein [Mucilaginibacter galii]
MMKINKMKIDEAKAVLAHLDRHGYDEISTLNVRSTLTAYSAVMQKKETVNDQIDIMRISKGIQISDIMFLDKERKFELNRTKLADKYQVKLFSGTKKDVIDCVTFLADFVGKGA